MLRVLATWDAKRLPALHAATDLETQAALGMLPGLDAEDWFAWSVDPRDDFHPDENTEPCTWLRETSLGIQVRRHPEAMLRDSPHLWDVVGKWRAGVSHEITREEYEAIPNFEIECWIILTGAHNREERRRIEERRESTE